MSGQLLGKKKEGKIIRKYNLSDVHHIVIGNGDHNVFICFNDGSQSVVKDDIILPTFPWSFHTSDFNKPIPPSS